MAARADMTLYLTELARSSRGGVARTVPRVVPRSWLTVAYINKRRLPKTSSCATVVRYGGKNGTDQIRKERRACMERQT